MDERGAAPRRAALGLISLNLLIASREWVNSRSESVEFLTENLVRRTVVIDISLDALRQSAGDELPSEYVPLTLLRKDQLPGVVIRDETGARVSTLSQLESTRVGGEVLKSLAAALTEGQSDNDEALARLMRDVAEAQANPKGALSALEAHVSGTKLDSASFWGLARSLAESYILFVFVPNTTPHHRVFSFESRVGIRSIRRGPRDVFQLLGWTSTTLWLEATSIGLAQTYEIEIAAPDGAGITVAKLITDPGIEAVGEYVDTTPTRAVRLGVLDAPRETFGVVALELAPLRAYTVGILVTALFAASILTVGRARLANVAASPDPATTLLLAGPTLFAALVAQPRGGSVGRKLLVAARLVLLLAGLLTFVAAGTLVTTNCLSTLRSLWTALAAFAWVSAAILLVGVVSPGALLKVRRVRRKLHHRGPSSPAL